MGQIARPFADISRSAGVWLFTSGTDAYAMCDETLSDGTTTEVGSPNTIGTHTLKMAYGTNWDGSALVRPYDNNSMMIRLDLRELNGAIQVTIRLIEDVAGNGYATVRESWALGVVSNTAYNYTRKNVAAATVDAIVDFTKLGIQIEYTIANAGRVGLATYSSIIMSDGVAPSYGSYSTSFPGTDVPRCFESYTINAVTPDLPSVSGGIFSLTTNGFVLIMTCYAQDFIADHYAKVTCATGYNNAKTATAGFTRQYRRWVTPGTDSVRYDCVPDASNVPPAHVMKYDGGASAQIALVAFSSVPNLVAGDTYETRSVGTTQSGRKNGVEIVSGTDALITGVTWTGFVLSAIGASPWVGISNFETGSVPSSASSGSVLGNRKFIGAGLK
jgi:hypothetical protein